MEEIDFRKTQGARVGLVVIDRYHVYVEKTEDQRGDGRWVAPFIPVSSCQKGGGDEGDQTQVEQVRSDKAGERIVEVRPWVVGAAEGAGGEHVRAELQVQEARFEVDEFVAQSVVGDGGRAQRGQAREEHVDGDLQAGLRQVEDALWCVSGEEGEGEVDEREGEEEE